MLMCWAKDVCGVRRGLRRGVNVGLGAVLGWVFRCVVLFIEIY